MSNQNQPVEAQVHENLFALQEELDNLYAQLGEYEGNYLNRAEARIAEIEAILAQAAQAPNNGNVANGNAAPRNYNEDPEEGTEEDPNINVNKTGGRRRKTRKARKASKKTRRTRHKKYKKRN